MFSFVLRRGSSISRKIFHLASTSQRCWNSTLPPQSHYGSTSTFVSNHRAAGRTFLLPRPVPPSQHTLTVTHCPTFTAYTRPIHSSAVHLIKRPQPEPPPRELDLIRYNMRDLTKSPKPALYLGFAGLLPFVCPTLFMAMTETFVPELAYAQVAYGASILSFLGGIRWGFALPPSSPAKPDWINLANSVVPSLMAWVAMLMSDSIVQSATMVIFGLGIALHYDLSLLPTYPSWFKALRTILTVVAFLSVLGMTVVYGIFPEKKLFTEQ